MRGKAFSSEVAPGSREENASKQESQPEHPLRDVVVGAGFHSVLVVPLVDQQGVLGALVVGVLQLADASHFALVLSQAEPAWLLVAIALQGLTYVVQGQLYRQVLTAAGTSLPLWDATKLSLTKLFIDQALPSSGDRKSVV